MIGIVEKSVEAQVVTDTAQIDALAAQLVQAQADLAQTQVLLAAAQNDLTAAQAQILQLELNVIALNAQIGLLQIQIAALEAQLAAAGGGAFSIKVVSSYTTDEGGIYVPPSYVDEAVSYTSIFKPKVKTLSLYTTTSGGYP
jgi:hypothetical protein